MVHFSTDSLMKNSERICRWNDGTRSTEITCLPCLEEFQLHTSPRRQGHNMDGSRRYGRTLDCSTRTASLVSWAVHPSGRRRSVCANPGDALLWTALDFIGPLEFIPKFCVDCATAQGFGTNVRDTASGHRATDVQATIRQQQRPLLVHAFP